jgi:hypothetical protein
LAFAWTLLIVREFSYCHGVFQNDGREGKLLRIDRRGTLEDNCGVQFQGSSLNGTFMKTLCVLLLAVAVSHATTAQFARVAGYPTTDPGNNLPGPSVAIADLNNDGNLDIVAANWGGTVAVLLGNGDGTFQPAVTYSSYQGNYFFSIAIADLNGDGNLDLVVLSANGPISIFFGNGDGTFQSPTTYQSSGGQTVALGDTRNNGIQDIIIAGSTINVLLGNSDGTFQPEVTYSSGVQDNDSLSLAVADLKNDGNLDIVATSGCVFGGRRQCTITGTVSVLIGNGDGTFQPAVLYNTNQYYPTGVAVADFNDDGKPDLSVSNYCSGPTTICGPATVSIFLGNGDGTFQPSMTYSTRGKDAVGLTVADFNGDGILDIAAPNYDTDNVAMLLGVGDGTFQKANAISFKRMESSPVAILAADLNGDGRPDLVVSGGVLQNGTGLAGIGVLLNITSAPTTTTVATSGSPSIVNQPVTFTATITSALAPIPNGQAVTFYNGKTEMGNGTTTNGVASFTTSFLTQGKHTIKATYAAHGFFRTSSGTVAQIVDPSGAQSLPRH